MYKNNEILYRILNKKINVFSIFVYRNNNKLYCLKIYLSSSITKTSQEKTLEVQGQNVMPVSSEKVLQYQNHTTTLMT